MCELVQLKVVAALLIGSGWACAQGARAPKADTPGSGKTVALHAEPTRDDVLRGGYGPFRANNDLLFYHLDLRVDPIAQTIKGSNTIRMRMLQDGTRVQLELLPSLQIDGITQGGKPLKYTREERTVWVDFADTQHKGSVVEIVFAYGGKPVAQGRFGCLTFNKDAAGKPWITTACEEEGASVWWPNKDQWRDEPQDGMEISVAVPNGLMDVSNGRFEGSKDLGNGYTQWNWVVHYGINNYDVALNIGDYQHFTLPQHGATTLDFYVLPEHLAKAKVQFAQVPQMLDAYEHFLGEYPFDKDGYKLVDVPYAGMEHQSAVAYGNHYANGYYERDWTGVGISPKFDFIIIHESGHEWFGNAITAADRSDMWIHEGWTTYMESLYVEYRFGKADAIRYLNGRRAGVKNQRPIITPRGSNLEPPQDQYDKGSLMINTLRSLVDDDAAWLEDLRAFFQNFEYQQIMSEDVVAWWSERTGMDLTAFFDEYLRHAAAPVFEWRYDAGSRSIEYRYKAEEPGFAMLLRVGDPAHWSSVKPNTTKWQSMPWAGSPNDFKVDVDHFYVLVQAISGEVK